MTDKYDQMTIDGSTRQQKLYDYSIEILRIAEPPEGYYLCTSFGKDSIAAQRLCDEAGVRYDAHHNITGIDPPELVQFGRKYYPDVQRHMYTMIKLDGRLTPGSMWRLIEWKGILPMRNKRFCCEVLKEGGGRGRRCVMGIRASESDKRKKSWAPVSLYASLKKDKPNGMRLFDEGEIRHRMLEPDDTGGSLHNCLVKDKLTVSPLYFWDDADLWDFLRDRKLPYCTLYDNDFKRLGCIGCPNAREEGKRKEFNHWPKFYDMYIRAIQRLQARGRYDNFATAEDVMEWWISDVTQDKPLEGQMGLDM